ncbi:MAG: hypothetical protein KHW57_07085 [Clostridium sp.]|nr:hypothetical protein [Clostridium sp.]
MMGTISDKLMRIINTKEDIRQALISKGYDVPTSIPFKEYAKMISDLPCRVDSFPDIEGIVARYSALGLTNEQMAANPVWVDKTGNGHDIQLKNFSWKGMSGVGGYVQDFNDFRNNATVDKIRIDEQGSNSIKVTILTTGIGNAIYIPKNIYQFNKSYFIKISSEGYDEGDMALSFYAPSTSTATTVTVSLNPNGVTEIPAIKEDDFLAVYINVSGKVGSFTVEQLPLYPGALVFDGVDDYGVCENFPILTKEKGYTVVALRQWISMGEGISGLVSNVKNWFNDGAFVLEYNSNNATNKFVNRPVSFGNVNIEMDLPNNFTYQTSKSYKGVPITKGSFKGTNSLFVGKLNNIIGNCSNVAIWELVFLDHDATEEELTKIKDYFVKTYPWLFPDQAWTVVGKTNEDEDRATIANITGNGNDLVLSNFGFAEGSGYGLYAENYAGGRWVQSTDRADLTWTSYSVNITSVKVASTQLYYQSYPEQPSFTVPSYKIKVYGLKDGQTLSYKQVTSEGQQIYKISEDGIYTLPSFLFKANGDWYGFTLDKIQETCDITIEQIPEYEGYLVTDGVDDKIVSSVFGMGKDFTIVGDWKLINTGKNDNAGIVKFDSIVIYNYNPILINIKNGRNNLIPDQNTVNAICSDGRIYSKDWKESIYNEETESTSKNLLTIGYSGNIYTKIAFKNLAIYPTVLSKEDCIKAYNYLQTLKSK